MNIVFWLLIVLALALLWFSLSFAFKGFGEFWLGLFNDAKEAIKYEEENEDEEIGDN